MGHSSQTLNYTQLDLLFFHHHCFFDHQSLFLFRLCIHLDLRTMGLAPDSDLGPYRMFETLLQAAVTLLRPAQLSPQETLLAQCSWDNADLQNVLVLAAIPRQTD